MKRKPVIIAYDISCNKRRRRVFKCLQAWRLDSQYSLFECLLSQKEAEELFLQLTHLIDTQEDRMLLAWLDKNRQTEILTHNAESGFKAPACYVG